MFPSTPVFFLFFFFAAPSADASAAAAAAVAGILSAADPTPLKLPGLVSDGSTIVTHSTLARMETTLPKHYRGYNYYLLYSTFR